MFEFFYKLAAVRRDQHRGADFVEFLEQMEQAQAEFRIEIAGRFIGEQKLGPRDHRAGDGEALLLAARQGRRADLKRIGQANPFEQLADLCGNLGLGETGNAQGQGDIIKRVEMIEQAEILKHHADLSAQGGKLMARHCGGVAIQQGDQAPRRPMGEIQQPEQGRLAGAARPGQKMKRSGVEREVYIAQDFGAVAVAHADILETNQPNPPPAK